MKHLVLATLMVACAPSTVLAKPPKDERTSVEIADGILANLELIQSELDEILKRLGEKKK